MSATALPSERLSASYLSNKDYPRSPSSISPLSRRESLPNKNIQSAAPHSPPSRSTPKRAASVNTDAANRLEDLALNSGSGSSHRTSSARDHVCLCQPDPKIPRPRNAFILYRQHYQAQVVAQHPGLANPDISKIIGEQWRDQPIEVKNDWKRLAEEEKLRHQRQYPDYRYQPKRAGKTTAEKQILSPDGENTRCPKCGGRYILTPSAPLTPFERSSRLPTRISAGSPPRPVEVDRSRFPHTIMNPPRTAPPNSQMDRRTHFPGQNRVLQLGPVRDHEEDIEMMSPIFKRRRFDNERGYPPPSSGYAPPTPVGYASSQRIVPRPPMSAGFYPDERRRNFQGADPYSPHKGDRGMDPPPRPTQHNYMPYSPRATPYDENLRLPPLQTPTSQHTSTGSLTRIDHQQRSVQAMVMTIPYVNKIKVLAKISPPLAPPGPASPVYDIRGAVIAVEGTDPAFVAEVGKFLLDHLSREPECLLKLWTPSPKKYLNSSEDGNKSPRDFEMTGTTPDVSSPSFEPNSGNNFIHYLEEIHSWHTKSLEIAKFITTLPSAISSPVPPHSPSLNPAHTTERNPLPTPTPPNSVSTPPDGLIAVPASPTSNLPLSNKNTTGTTASKNSSTTKRRIPIALLPHGFSVTTSDTFASSIPINDAYAPVDHWQWMATLWRGIIGPDLTIYVKNVAADGINSFNSSGGTGIGNGEGGVGGRDGSFSARDPRDGMTSREELLRTGGVEVRQDCRAIIVRTEAGVGVEEKTLRRLGFEVLEFVRGEGAVGALGPWG